VQSRDGLDEARDAGGRAPQRAEEPPGLEGGDGLLDQGSDFCLRPVDGLLACGEVLPTSPVRNPDRAPGTPISFVGPAGDAGVRESGGDAVFTGGPDIVDGSGQSRRRPQQPAGSARTRTFIPCFLCLPEDNGRSAAMRPIGSRVPSSSTNAFVDAVRAASARVGARAARNSTASATYRWAVVVPMRNRLRAGRTGGRCEGGRG
jgi:hypothetical protein